MPLKNYSKLELDILSAFGVEQKRLFTEDLPARATSDMTLHVNHQAYFELKQGSWPDRLDCDEHQYFYMGIPVKVDLPDSHEAEFELS